MTAVPGEILLVDLGMVGKVRPAVVVSREDPEAPRRLLLCVPITSQNRGSRYEVALGRLDFLEKDSWANVQGLTSIEYARFCAAWGEPRPRNWNESKGRCVLP